MRKKYAKHKIGWYQEISYLNRLRQGILPDLKLPTLETFKDYMHLWATNEKNSWYDKTKFRQFGKKK